jgi:hypothetical protein
MICLARYFNDDPAQVGLEPCDPADQTFDQRSAFGLEHRLGRHVGQSAQPAAPTASQDDDLRAAARTEGRRQ